ncbi:FecR family protein [Robiginitalea marina]|uniref:FecR domain-containing protein n=1 Tax=Robiginitalea marina TaxID=2954105 RepID=A0ABT1B106_9FLAO|nr:FecR domain-containing protein [Robiginitalea marina]MCO5725273.1 FecR domain-containing protein [Robiginitalea marina]
MKENYLAKWLNGDLSDEELKVFRESPEYKTYRKIAEVSTRLQGPEFDVEQALEQAKEGRRPSVGKVVALKAYRQLWKVAAAVVVLLGIGYFYVNSLETSIQAGLAQRSEVVLPDASEVILNAGSEVSYRDKSWENRRLVSLKGEAFFKVAKGQTFTVETDAGKVTVLGTQFNVLQRGDIFSVTCFEGRVRVDHQGTSLELAAGQGYQVAGGSFKTFEVAAGARPSWMEDESSFRSLPLSFILEELERQHSIRVETRGVDTGVLFTGTFSNTNLDLALKSISAPLQLGYTREGDKVLLYAQDTP